MTQVYLYIHVIWSTQQRMKWLTKPVRIVLFSQLKKNAEERGIKIIRVDGGEEHVHVLLQLHPAQNLSQVVRQLKSESEEWLNGTQLLHESFSWSDEMIAYTVSPGALQQVVSFIEKQEEYHQSRSYVSEIEVFHKNDKEQTL